MCVCVCLCVFVFVCVCVCVCVCTVGQECSTIGYIQYSGGVILSKVLGYLEYSGDAQYYVGLS